MTAITLANEFLRVVVDPEKGASVVAFSALKAGAWLSLLPDSNPGFLMIPYSNRIENGRFSFEGSQYQLAPGEDHAIHGDVHLRSWTPNTISPSHISCQFSAAAYPDINWPWPFEARVDYQLRENVFASRLVLWNRGDTAMPAGMGWHPYFNRVLGQANEVVRLCVKVKAAYPDANGNRIPSGPAGKLTPEQDFSTEKPLAPDNFLDTCFQGYDGHGYIVWPESGIRVSYQCTPECTHLVIYNPLHQPYFAVEPVTNANNGVNLFSRGETHSGIVSLPPGKSFEAGFEQRVDILS